MVGRGSDSSAKISPDSLAVALPMPVRFTRHALEKLNLLARHGFDVSLEQIVNTVENPDLVVTDRDPCIAQKGIDEEHVLRVVFRNEGHDFVVITLYPGRRDRYEG